MSGRGGGGGRGGGRGRGAGRGAVPPSVASAPFNYGAAASGGSSTGLYSLRTEPSQRFPEILLPEPPNYEKFSALELAAADFSDRIDSLLKMSPSFRPIKTTQIKIDRYSDKYLSHVINGADRRDRLNSIQSSLEFFPEELHSVYNTADTLPRTKKKSTNHSVSFKETISQLESLAQKEESTDDNDEKEKKEKTTEDSNDEDVENEEFDDEEFEDDTDYNLSYFDNGEDHAGGGGGGDYDDGNDEAVF